VALRWFSESRVWAFLDNVPKLIAVGGITVDYVRTRAGLAGPNLGGNALYAAVGGWLVGSHPAVLANVGEDFPDGLLKDIGSLGFDMNLVGRVAGPSMKVVLDETSGVRVQRYAPGSGDNGLLDPEAASLPPLTGNAVHVCGLPISTQRAFLRVLWQHALVTTFDTVVIPGQIEPRAIDLESLMDSCDVFVPSIEEVEAVWPGGEVVPWLQSQARQGRAIVVKAGAAGALSVNGNGEVLLMAAAPAQVVDTTGAGDTYGGAFATMLASHGDIRIAMAWGAAAASVVIEGHGALHAISNDRRGHTRERASQLLQEYSYGGNGR
jgi:sugar/nucleoside kinase (ribokinase family)